MEPASRTRGVVTSTTTIREPDARSDARGRASLFTGCANPRGEVRCLTRATLDALGSEQVADTGYLRLSMSQLRKKLEADPAAPRHLLTESGMRYRLVTDP